MTAWLKRAGHWLRRRGARLADWAAPRSEGLIFSGALTCIAVGFGLAWLPLGFIVPGMLVCGVMVAYRWRSTFGKAEGD